MQYPQGGYNPNTGYDNAAYGPGGYPVQQGQGYDQGEPKGAPPAYPGYPPTQTNNAYPPPAASSTVSPYIDVESSSDNAGFASANFSDKVIRHRFIRKVYLILTTQLIFTLVIIAWFLFHKPTQNFIQENYWLYYISYGIFLVTYITLICCKNVRQKTPGNYICLVVFTIAFTYMAATITTYYDVTAVLIAASITVVVCIAVTIFSMQTKFDFTKCSSLLFVLLLVLLLFGISVIIVYSVPSIDNKTKYVLQCVYGTLGALVFTLFLAYDTQMIAGGRKYKYSEEDYISASLQLYLDVVYIFLFLLMAMGGGSKS